MRTLFTCGREPDYVRNRLVRKALRRLGPVEEVTDASPSYPARLARLALRLLRGLPRHDLAFVGFYGYPLVFPVRLLTRKPLVFDAFLSTFDTLCHERRRFRPESPAGRLLRAFDRRACLLADRVLIDTEEHRDYLAELLDVPAERFAVLPVGAEDDLFQPRPPRPPDGTFHVFFYGSFLPLQGVEHIVEAARVAPEIRFTLAGDGPLRARIRKSAGDLSNVEFPGWIPYRELPERIAAADACLGGHFTTFRKAACVVSTKTYQFLACARPTIVGDLPANRSAFEHERHVLAVPPEDPGQLALALRRVRDERGLRDLLAEQGRRRFVEAYSQEALARRLESILSEWFVNDGKPP